MRVSRLRLGPFGFFADQQVEFSPGLNVVLGPNEAGKSTIFRAIQQALLVSTNLTKRERAVHVEPYLPVSGGDSIRVDLEFYRNGERWVLRRRWGASAASQLVMPGGGTLSDEAGISTKLADLLPARQGVLRHILMTRQSALPETLLTLRGEGRESLADLEDVLRRAVLQTGNVPVDRFVQRLKEDSEKAFAHWDKAAKGPEKSKGMEKRWARGSGTVLAAWYSREDAGADWKKADEDEKSLDEVNARLGAALSACAEQESYLASNAGAAKDAQDRRRLVAELRAARSDAEKLARAVTEWPVAIHSAGGLSQAISAAEASQAGLERERLAAEKASEARTLLEKHARVLRRKALADEAAAKLAALPRLEQKALDEIRAATASLSRLEAGIEAGRISVTVAGRAEVELAAQEDFRPEERRTLGAGATLRLRATGRVRIVHPDMEIEVRSGDADAEARAEKAETARVQLKALLARHGVPDAETAEERSRSWENSAADQRAAEKSLAEELGGETLASLAGRVDALGQIVPVRPLQDVTADLAALREKAAAQVKDLTELRRRIGEWEAAYGTPEKLVFALAAAKGREGDLDAAISRQAPLPAGSSDAEAFLQEFEKAKADLSHAKEDMRGLEERKRALEKESEAWGNQSAEELAVRLRDAEEAFEAELHRAEALERVLVRSTELLRTSDSTVFSGIRARLSSMVSAMTAGRHSDIVMERAVPVGLGDAQGHLSWEQLSAGTRDTLALALRLAMASYFLGTADGFMLLDDPLVDMDPDRQKAAVKALQSFASSCQLVVFTCHPAAAELLGGILVRLPPQPPAPRRP